MPIELSPEDRKTAETFVTDGHFRSIDDVLHAGLKRLAREEQYKALVKRKIAAGLDDIAAGRTVSREEFLNEIKERRRISA